MGSRRAALVTLALIATVTPGCGESTAKRAVDARAEVLGFFSVDAPVVAMLDPQPPGDVASLDQAAAGVPLWAEVRSTVVRRFEAAGLSAGDLRRLVRPQEPIEGLEAAALGFGAPTPTDLEAGQTLLVLATDQDELLENLLREAVDSGELQPAGNLDEAELYSNRTASYAERDGVLVSAPSPGVVRSAITRRDGDSDQQLDEDVVSAALRKLQDPGPLGVYVQAPELLGEPAVRRLFAGASWIDSADDAAASVRAAGETVEVEAVVNLDRDLEPADRPLGEQPEPVTFLLSGLGLGQVSGFGSATEDEVRLRLRIGP